MFRLRAGIAGGVLDEGFGVLLCVEGAEDALAVDDPELGERIDAEASDERALPAAAIAKDGPVDALVAEHGGDGVGVFIEADAEGLDVAGGWSGGGQLLDPVELGHGGGGPACEEVNEDHLAAEFFQVDLLALDGGPFHVNGFAEHVEALEVIRDAGFQRVCAGVGLGALEKGAGGGGVIVEGAGDLREEGGDAAVVRESGGECAGLMEEGVAVGAGDGIDALHEDGDAGERDIRAAVAHGGVGIEVIEDGIGLAAAGVVLLEIGASGEEMGEAEFGVGGVGVGGIAGDECADEGFLFGEVGEGAGLGLVAGGPVVGGRVFIRGLDV